MMRIDGEESPEKRVERLISENPVVVFSRPSCCMCHVTKRLLSNIGVHPTVIESDDTEMESLVSSSSSPTVFIGGEFAGGIETLVSLHLGGLLVPMLREAGALGTFENVM